MKIQWIKTKQDLKSVGISNEFSEHPLIHYNEINTESDLCLVFNDKSHIDKFLEASNEFNYSLNNLKLQLGLIYNEKSKPSIHLDDINIESPVLFFGNTKQEKSFLKIFNSSCAFISKNCEASHKTIAYQRHLTKDIHAQSVSLGEFKSDFGRAESYLRAVQAIFFRLNSIRKQDSFFKDSNLTGLNIYEACQILRFSGMSTDHSFMFINISDELEYQNSWECISTLIWYYIEGKNQIEIDSVDHKQNHIYMVENSLFADPICFIEAHLTKRWWFVHPETKDKIPCSENDYQAMREGSIPELLLSLCME